MEGSTKKAADLIEKLGDRLEEHKVMRQYTYLGIGGVADFFYEAKTAFELIKAVNAAFELDIPYFILGNGSNIIFSDYGFGGLVIKNSSSNITFMKDESQVIVDSGFSIKRLIAESSSNDLSGLEFLYGVPGTVGGAVCSNIGAFGLSIGDFVRSAAVLIKDADDNKLKIIQLDRDWFDFSYRQSKLKSNFKYPPVILTVKIQLAQNRKDEIIRRLQDFKKRRESSQPLNEKAISIFKNPQWEELIRFPGKGTKNMPEFVRERTAGYLLEKSEVKKIKNKVVKVWAKHANFLINNNDASAKDFKEMIDLMKKMVDEKHKVTLEEEVQFIGQW